MKNKTIKAFCIENIVRDDNVEFTGDYINGIPVVKKCNNPDLYGYKSMHTVLEPGYVIFISPDINKK
jgi:hypothetical protein